MKLISPVKAGGGGEINIRDREMPQRIGKRGESTFHSKYRRQESRLSALVVEYTLVAAVRNTLHTSISSCRQSN
jgi:hypothetical protein